MSKLRQKLLILYTSNSFPEAKVIGFSSYDGSQEEKVPQNVDAPMPYDTVLEAMYDGWRVIQFPSIDSRKKTDTNYLEFEFVLEKIVELSS